MTDRDRLIELFKGAESKVIEELNKHLELDEEEWMGIYADYLIANGVICLPCKVGDKVYTSYDHLLHKETSEILECKVAFIGFIEDGNYINLVDNYGHLHSMSFDIFDNTVFLTREEAEKALERSKGNA